MQAGMNTLSNNVELLQGLRFCSFAVKVPYITNVNMYIIQQ